LACSAVSDQRGDGLGGGASRLWGAIMSARKAADAIDATPAKETAAGGPAFFSDDISFEAAL
jgi:hypothetical protein